MAKKQTAGSAGTGVEVITNAIPYRRRVMKRGQKASGCWVESPAVLKLFTAALWMLEELAHEREADLGTESRVTMIRAARVKGKNDVYIYPTDWDDPLGILLNRKPGRITANLYDFMADASWLVDLHHAERFTLTVAGDDSPVGPALVFERTQVLERKYIPPTKRKTKAEREAEKNKKLNVTDKGSNKTGETPNKTAASTDPQSTPSDETESE